MKSKKFVLFITLMMTFFFSVPSTSLAAPVKNIEKTTLSDEEAAKQISEMRERVKEIKAMDRSKLTKTERKALRKELREMNKKARALGSGGVYLSVGAIIIIILVLILIL